MIAVIHHASFHYTTYVRRAYVQWEMHNDLEPKIKKIKNFKNILVNPHLIMYIKE